MRMLSLVFVIALLTTVCFADIINVPDDFETVQAGINAAENGDTVLVAPGEYTENLNFNGRCITLSSFHLIDGEEDFIERTVIDGGEEDHVILIEDCADGIVVNGFDICNGRPADASGAGIRCINSDAVFSNLLVHNNSALGRNKVAGGIYIRNGNINMSDVAVFDNESDMSGGGIYWNNCSGELVRVKVIDNHSEHGGGIYFFGTERVILRYCLIGGNQVGVEGGGISINGSRVDLINVTMASNTANYSGGGIWAEGDFRIYLQNSIMWNNNQDEIAFGVDEGFISPRYCNIRNGEEGIVYHHNGDFIVDWEEGNIDEDPLFVENDFILTEDSPCIDTGDPESDPDPDGTRADMGAFYYIPDFQFELSTDTLDFGSVAVGGSGDQVLTILNTGRNVIAFDSVYSSLPVQFTPFYNAAEVRLVILDIVAAAAAYRDDYREDPSSIEELLELDYLEIREDIAEQWSFVLIGSNPITQIESVSTQEMPGGCGHVILYDYGSDRFTGYGSIAGDELEPGEDLQIPVVFRPAEIRGYTETLSIICDDQDNPEMTVLMRGVGIEPDEVNNGRSIGLPSTISIAPPYPNPFNSSTTINFNLPTQSSVTLGIFNTRGQMVYMLLDQEIPAGKHSVVWDGSRLCTGVYLIRMVGKDENPSNIQKIVLVK